MSLLKTLLQKGAARCTYSAILVEGQPLALRPGTLSDLEWVLFCEFVCAGKHPTETPPRRDASQDAATQERLTSFIANIENKKSFEKEILANTKKKGARFLQRGQRIASE